MTGLSLSILSAENSQSIQLQTFSSCGAHIRSGDNIFLFMFQRQQSACNGPLESLLITWKMHLYRHFSRFLGRLLDFSSVWEGSWIWACGRGNIVWGGGGGLTNSKWLLACIGYHPQGGTLIFSAYVGSDPVSTVHQKKISEISSTPKIFEILATPKNIPILYLDLKKRP